MGSLKPLINYFSAFWQSENHTAVSGNLNWFGKALVMNGEVR